MTAYYNEIDKHAAAWLRELIKRGLIAPGDVDERSIVDVSADDLRSYDRLHFFAGIGTWDYSLTLAGWPDGVRVATASLPCQPFSVAGRAGTVTDERHLWPVMFRLIRELGIDYWIGEQVGGRNGYAFLDHVANDMESIGYAIGAICAPACGFGAPHKRERLYWCAVAESDHAERRAEGSRRNDAIRPHTGRGGRTWGGRGGPENERDAGLLGDAESDGWERRQDDLHGGRRQCPSGQAGPTNGFWADAEWLACTDGKARATGHGISPLVVGNARLQQSPGWGSKENGSIRESCNEPAPSGGRATQPGTFPLVDGTASRVGPSGDSGPSAAEVLNMAEARVMRLRGYGNAIVAPQAAEFIRAFLDVMWGRHV